VNCFADSADGASTIAIFSTRVWQMTNSGVASPCHREEFSTVRDYLTARVQRDFEGARIPEYHDRPDFAGPAIAAGAASGADGGAVRIFPGR